MVNIQGLTNDLSTVGNIVLIGENNITSFIIVMESVTIDESSIKNIIESYVLNDYPILFTLTLIDGVLKCEYTK